MLTVNEYFDGKVKSIGLNNASGKNTVGVMDIGKYEFGTSPVQYKCPLFRSETLSFRIIYQDEQNVHNS